MVRQMVVPFLLKNATFYPLQRIMSTQGLFYAKMLHMTALFRHKCVETQKNQSCMALVVHKPKLLKVNCGYTLRNMCTELNYLHNSSNKVLNILENNKFINGERFDVTSFLDLLFNEENLTVNEWDTLKQKLLHYRRCNEVNFSGKMMNGISLKKNYTLAKSFLEYLREKKMEPNVATLSAYLYLCSFNVEVCGEETILSAYKNIVSKIKILDSITRHNIVQALSVTSHWMIAYDIINKNELVPSECENYCAVSSAAFKHNRTDIALKLVQQIFSLRGKLTENVYVRWLEAALNNPSELHQLIEQLLSYLTSSEALLPVNCVDKLVECFKSLKNEKWTSKLVNINRQGICPNCNHRLSCIDVTTDQFNMLKDAVLSKLMKDTDVYLKTTPDELNRFLNFVKHTSPYDLVIDGLNVSHYQSKKSAIDRALQLYYVVKHFAKNKNLKILILGRRHMKNWPRKYMDSIQQMAHVFYTDNISQDDPFMIYAAVYSGPKTLVMTKDLLRNHKFSLQDPTLAMYFERWRSTHQMFLDRVYKETGTVKYQEPLHHSITAQGSMTDSWHIPYDNNNVQGPYDICEHWLCLTKIK
ncbi:mitochondrial ribonuclease P protein 3-like [Centruroides sculpturatus]|uniref:mitochondrial ribonuclease P protein 3-like n=1 Tax=Centruroides sculpturatus TaxID=218467 RepID=UPI000C6EA1D8|nr:mitochondrial ribonuclease P protein 3-like [Centruroides sculpturatus]